MGAKGEGSMPVAFLRGQISPLAYRSTLIRRLAVWSAPALVAASLATAPSPAAAQAKVQANTVTIDVAGSSLAGITTSPLSLTPAFDPTITDYVLRCQAGTNTIHATLVAAGGTIRSLGIRGASVDVQENLVENEALVIAARAPRSRVDNQQGQAGSQDENGRTQYWIRCLPHDFPQLTVSKPGTPPPGWYLTGNENSVAGSGTYAMVLDNNGTPVWYRKPAGDGAINVTLLPDGTIAWKSNAGPGFEDYNLKTQTTRWLVAPVPPTDLHELHALSNGNLMMLSYQLRSNFDLSALGLSSTATIIDCVVEEMDRHGQLVWQWRASDHISADESAHPSQTLAQGAVVYDIYHCNSVDVDPASGNVLLSSRHTDAIYLINKRSGLVISKMGGTSPNHDNSLIIRVMGDPQGTFHAQHDARFQPNGDVSLYDDQTWDSSLVARGVEYHIDVAARTATLVWAYQSPDSRNSAATGSFRMLNAGNDNVVGWGFKPNALLTEVDGSGTVMLTVAFPSGEEAYRAIKVPTSAFDHRLLRATAGLPRFVLP